MCKQQGSESDSLANQVDVAHAKSSPKSNQKDSTRMSFSVIEGGKLCRLPQLLVVDTSGMQTAAQDMLVDACARGLRVVQPQGLRAEDRVQWLVQTCADQQISLHDAAVIAQEARDKEMLFEAGVAYALEDAGYEVCAAADKVFSRKAQGGLTAAVQAICVLLR